MEEERSTRQRKLDCHTHDTIWFHAETLHRVVIGVLQNQFRVLRVDVSLGHDICLFEAGHDSGRTWTAV